MLSTLKSSLSIIPYLVAITFNEMWKKIWRKEKRAAVAESSAAAGAKWVAAGWSTAAESYAAAAAAGEQWAAAGWSVEAESSAVATWSAAARAQWAAVGWSAAEESSAVAGWSAAAGAQWGAVGWSAAAESSAPAGWSVAVGSSTATGEGWAVQRPAAEYRSGSFEKFEREEFRLVLGRSISSSTLAQHQGARLGTWGGERRGEGSAPTPPHKPRCPIGHLGWGTEEGGRGVCPTPPHKPRCLIVKENIF